MRPDRRDGHILIVGGGGTGGALAHDLSLRGLRVTLVERGELTSGTTGRHHGMLHSGGRYAVNDRESAVECIEENTILRRICPGSFESNDGLFVAVEDEDMEYLQPLLDGCEAAGIPAQRLTPGEALALEPNLNPELKAAVRVPDGSMDAMRLPLRFFATAQHNGATIRPYTEVKALLVHDHRRDRRDRPRPRHRPGDRDPRRRGGQRRRPLVGEHRRHGRRRCARSGPRRACCWPSAAASATW